KQTKKIEKNKQLIRNQDNRLFFPRLLEKHCLYAVANRQLIAPLEENPDYVLVRDKVCVFFRKREESIEVTLAHAGWRVFWQEDVLSYEAMEQVADEIIAYLSSKQGTDGRHEFVFV